MKIKLMIITIYSLGLQAESPKLQFEISPVGWANRLGPSPNWDSRLLLTIVFPAPIKTRCRLPQFGDVCAFASPFSHLLMTVY